jgi:hypothetical protein
VIGPDYEQPKVCVPGAGGAPEIAAACPEVVVVGDATGWDLRVANDLATTEATGEELAVLRELVA